MADTVTVPHTPRKINMAPALKVVVEDTWDTEVQKLKGKKIKLSFGNKGLIRFV